MKTINELIKEIEKMREKRHKAFLEIKKNSKKFFSRDSFKLHCEYDDLKVEVYELEAKLQTLQEVCKEIDKMIDNYKELNKKFPKNQTFVDMWTALFALKLRLQGEEDEQS